MEQSRISFRRSGRTRHSLFTAAAAGSSLLCVGVCVLWVTSYQQAYKVHWRTGRPRGDDWTVIHYEVHVLSGKIGAYRRQHVVPFADLPLSKEERDRWLREGEGVTFAWGQPQDLSLLSEDPRMPFVAFAAAFTAIPAWWLHRVGMRRRSLCRAERNHCPACGYDLRASPDRCPECGAVRVV